MPRYRVFISYSHKDRVWLEALQVHLRPLEREQRITRWDDTLIQSGARWKLEISKALEEARVAVLLVSKHFLASDFITADELPPLLAAAEHQGALILPVLVGPCRFNRTPGLADYQAVNSPERTLMERASVTAVPATFLGVHDALASGKFDVLHFSTHSSHAQGTPSQWKLYLEDQEALTPED